jgi:hypothetical protein
MEGLVDQVPERAVPRADAEEREAEREDECEQDVHPLRVAPNPLEEELFL